MLFRERVMPALSPMFLFGASPAEKWCKQIEYVLNKRSSDQDVRAVVVEGLADTGQ